MRLGIVSSCAARRRVRLLAALVCLAACFASAPRAPAAAETFDAATAVRSGVEMEREKKWLNAIEHYEKALKDWPDSEPLKYGLRRSKIHFGIERRYSDRSFDDDLLRLSRAEALRRFDEVLEQVRDHYVDPLSCTSFVAHGTESFYLALANERFAGRHLPLVDPERTNGFRKRLREEYWNRPVADASDARQVVEEVCDAAQRDLGLPGSAVVMEYVFGGCNALDDYSNYLTPDRLQDLYGNIEGEFVGLGIEMKAEAGQGLLLVNVLPGSPAEEGGLRRGDHIVEIDGRNCRDMTTDEAARLLRGPSGSRVRLKHERNPTGQVRVGEFLRREVQVKSIPVAKIIDRENGIGYIQMTGFQKSSATELDAALADLRRQGMRSLIWDLRGNPGGLLTSAVEVLDRFITDGVLVSTKGRTPDQNWTYSARRPGTWNIPLVLLVDGDSASASEIVAGAIHDHKRGVIVGRQTFGKWSVQSILPLHGSSGLRLTTAKFYSPDGHTLGKIGVRPDRVVELDSVASHETFFRGADEISPEYDPDLRAGVNELQRQLTRR